MCPLVSTLSCLTSLGVPSNRSFPLNVSLNPPRFVPGWLKEIIIDLTAFERESAQQPVFLGGDLCRDEMTKAAKEEERKPNELLNVSVTSQALLCSRLNVVDCSKAIKS